MTKKKKLKKIPIILYLDFSQLSLIKTGLIIAFYKLSIYEFQRFMNERSFQRSLSPTMSIFKKQQQQQKTVCMDSQLNPFKPCSLAFPVNGNHPRVLLKYRLWFSRTGVELLTSFEAIFKYDLCIRQKDLSLIVSVQSPIMNIYSILLLPRGRLHWPIRPLCGSF